MRALHLPHNQILVGDTRFALDQLPNDSVDCVITSPPYFRLRNYGQAKQIGLEDNVDQWVDELLLVMHGLKRVLKQTGSLWLNLGDTFARHARDGATPKSLVMAPERLALRMVEDGWILRNKVIWAKSNPMPTSVKDRLSCTWEVVYFFTREERYCFDLDAIRVPHQGAGRSATRTTTRPATAKATSAARRTRRPGRHAHAGQAWSVPTEWQGPSSGSNTGLDALKASGLPGHPLGKNPGDVWTMPTAAYHGAHHAVYPRSLVERPLLASCPEKVCASCGTAWRRQHPSPISGKMHGTTSDPAPLTLIGRLTKNCACETSASCPGVVLDPFIGSGTTAIVAEAHGRDWLGIELSPAFAEQARQRIGDERRKRGANIGPAVTEPDPLTERRAA